MRTTLEIEPDVLQAAKEIAAKEKSTAGAVISRLARAGLLRPWSEGAGGSEPEMKNGVPVIRGTGQVITLRHVQRLLDEEGV